MKIVNQIVAEAIRLYPPKILEKPAFLREFFERVINDPEASENAKLKAKWGLKTSISETEKYEDPVQVNARKTFFKRKLNKAIKDGKLTDKQLIKIKKDLKKYGI